MQTKMFEHQCPIKMLVTREKVMIMTSASWDKKNINFEKVGKLSILGHGKSWRWAQVDMFFPTSWYLKIMVESTTWDSSSFHLSNDEIIVVILHWLFYFYFYRYIKCHIYIYIYKRNTFKLFHTIINNLKSNLKSIYSYKINETNT